MGKFKIEDVFNLRRSDSNQSLTNQWVVAITGRVIEGDVKIGDFITINEIDHHIDNIERFRKAFNTSKQGDNISLLIKGEKSKFMEYRGQTFDIKNLNEIRNDKLIKLGL